MATYCIIFTTIDHDAPVGLKEHIYMLINEYIYFDRNLRAIKILKDKVEGGRDAMAIPI